DAAQLEAYKASLDQANADYETAIIAARADVAGAKARVTDAQIDLGYCRMSSPIDGRSGLAQVRLGNLAGPGPQAGSTDHSEAGEICAEWGMRAVSHGWCWIPWRGPVGDTGWRD